MTLRSGSNTDTEIPSRPSAVLSASAVTVKVAVVSPLAIVTVPDCELTSEPDAFSTVPSLSLPITLYVR